MLNEEEEDNDEDDEEEDEDSSAEGMGTADVRIVELNEKRKSDAIMG